MMLVFIFVFFFLLLDQSSRLHFIEVTSSPLSKHNNMRLVPLATARVDVDSSENNRRSPPYRMMLLQTIRWGRVHLGRCGSSVNTYNDSTSHWKLTARICAGLPTQNHKQTSCTDGRSSWPRTITFRCRNAAQVDYASGAQNSLSPTCSLLGSASDVASWTPMAYYSR